MVLNEFVEKKALESINKNEFSFLFSDVKYIIKKEEDHIKKEGEVIYFLTANKKKYILTKEE